MKFCPEGTNDSLAKKFNSLSEIKATIDSREIFEGRVLMCDREHNLHIDLGFMRGIIPRYEGAYGIIEGTVRDIALISKVGKRVCFRIMGFHRDGNGNMWAVLSRRSVQIDCIKEYINHLNPGDIVDTSVTHLEKFGAFIDIGAGINSLIPIDMLSVSRISHPAERLNEGRQIKAVLKSREGGKLTFSLKELLGTWQENADLFSPGETVTGIVRSIEAYGVFVELTPNLAGLAEADENLKIGSRVSVYIKSIIPEKMKIKLVIVDAFDEIPNPEEPAYFISENHIDFWQYSPDGAVKDICTKF